MSKVVLQINAVDENEYVHDGPEGRVYKDGQMAMTPQQIADVLCEIDPDDLLDLQNAIDLKMHKD